MKAPAPLADIGVGLDRGTILDSRRVTGHIAVVGDQPTGTVTLLFTDVEGSTRLLQQIGRDRYAEALDLHRELLRAAFEGQGAYEVDSEGDAFFVAFSRAEDGVAAASEAQRALADAKWPQEQEFRVRMGLHTGTPLAVPPKYVGLDVHRAARIMGAAHGGQVLISGATRELLGDGPQVRDLGDHRLKDLAQPQRLFQLLIEGLPGEFPPPRTLENRPTNLPLQPNPLIGREQELQELRVLLAREQVHLVTLTGTGGTGKTRLGLQLAAEAIDDFPDGVFFVTLAPVNDPRLVLPTIAQALGVREQTDTPVDITLRNHLADKRVLLLLDNLEHLLEAATSIAALLAGVGTLKVLATSREPLHVSGERIYDVPPLSIPNLSALPELAMLTQFESVALFIERAQAARTGFAVSNENAPAIAEICARLDGLPLALELAAARIRVLPPQALLKRLDQRLQLLTGGARDLEERQQTLRATIEWSYELLSADEKSLFARIGVFVGGCRIEAAEAVCDPKELGILDGLSSLVEKSLLRESEDLDGEPRFWMLETIREFALNRLDESSETNELFERHAECYRDLGAEAAPKLVGDEADLWLGRLDAELDNLRAAMGRALARSDGETELQLAASLNYFWDMRGYFREGERWITAGLSSGSAVAPVTRATALHALGHMLVRQGEYPRAHLLFQESIALFRSLPALPEAYVYALADLAFTVHQTGNTEEGRALAREATQAANASGSPRTQAWALNALGIIHTEEGAQHEAQETLEQAITISRGCGDRRLVGIAASNLAELFLGHNDWSAALPLLEESLAAGRALGDLILVAHVLSNVGFARLFQGQSAEAETAFIESLTLARPSQAARIGATSLLGLAGVAAGRGQYSRAARLAGAMKGLLETLGAVPWAIEREVERELLREAKEGLGYDWATGLDDGRKLGFEQAITYALEQEAGLVANTVGSA